MPCTDLLFSTGPCCSWEGQGWGWHCTRVAQQSPGSGIAREADQLVRDTTSELVYHHSQRVFWFGALQGRRRDLRFDPELLCIGALFHDLGLGERFHGSGRRFEVDSADEARRFLQSHHVPEDSIRRVWTAIALHTTPGIPQFMEVEVSLVTTGVEYDVLGIGYEDIAKADRAEIVALHPRPDFKRRILAAVAVQPAWAIAPRSMATVVAAARRSVSSPVVRTRSSRSTTAAWRTPMRTGTLRIPASTAAACSAGVTLAACGMRG